MGGAPDVVLPAGDGSAGIKPGGKMHPHRGTEWRPAQFIGPAPHAHHGRAGRPGQQCGVQRHIVGAIVAIAARSLRMDDANLSASMRSAWARVFRNGKMPCECDQTVTSPSCHASDGGAGTDRRVCNIRPRIIGLMALHPIGLGYRIGDNGGTAGGERRHPAVGLGMRHQFALAPPPGTSCRGLDRGQCLLVAAGDHADKAAVDHHIDDPGQRRIFSRSNHCSRSAGCAGAAPGHAACRLGSCPG